MRAGWLFLIGLMLFKFAGAEESKLPQGSLEFFLQSKKGPTHGESCEDGLFFSSHYLVVVDGASDKTGHRFDGHTGGWICKETILEVFRSLPGSEAPERIVGVINEALRERYKAYDIDYRNDPQVRFSASLIWYDFDAHALYAVGDCKARIDGKPYNAEEKTVDRLHSELRCEVLALQERDLSQPLEHDPGRDYILPLLKNQTEYQNRADAPESLQYWVIDGTDIPDEEIRRWSFSEPPRVIELSSDGYAEFPSEMSVSGYEATLKELLEEDPNLAHRVKSTKGLKPGNTSFDDRTILIFKSSGL